MYIGIRVQWTIIAILSIAIMNSDYYINNINLSIVFSQHPYCCVNNIVLKHSS